MPAETHQLGRHASAEEIFDLLLALLGGAGDEGGSTLESLGVDDDGLGALWDAVCEEFAERTVGPELEPGTLAGSMTLEAAAHTMALLLAEMGDDAG
ncbi:MAG TPA: hypothetical protein VE991_06040 [Acidimicrobiales bacterium]|nr:hypothetical protein [Acidimicrobiales bacterium]